ncbi:hypothetical protein V865_008473 [Kwoniella europaea PYCC6329]|uniref:Protein CPL1-like domain-containing protein n=1 Tax=Kwoniella europaea PYCC6329 TaxID=1423913 RepID=A0AAX4KX44_9TREE
MGCYPYASGPQLYSNDPISMEACAAGCTNTYSSLHAFKYYYSYFNPDIQATDIRYVCECGNDLGYTPSDWTYGESCGQANFYDPPITTVWLLKTTFSRLGCSILTDYEERQFSNVPDFEACFAQCQNSEYAFVDRAVGDGIRCSCSDESTYQELSSCQGTTLQDFNWMIFQHPPGSSGAPSGWVRRQMKERLAREAGQKALAVCPKDMTACRTSTEDDFSFEECCLDVQSELESCGGCTHGSFGQADNGIRGINCLSLPGVSQNNDVGAQLASCKLLFQSYVWLRHGQKLVVLRKVYWRVTLASRSLRQLIARGSFEAPDPQYLSAYGYPACAVGVSFLDPIGHWTWGGCYNLSESPDANTFVWSPAADFGECLNQCRSSPIAFARYNADLSPSSFVKRSRKEGQRVLDLCPEGSRACEVPDGEGLRCECIDIDNDLESCGGCTSLCGVSFGGVTCHQGICEVESCEEGYKLVEGTCRKQ